MGKGWLGRGGLGVLVVFALGASCKPGDDDTDGGDDTDEVEPQSQTIGAAGGTFVAFDGAVTLSFPPGAVDADTVISVQPIPSPHEDFVDGTTWEFGPDGSAFRQPVSITLAYDPADVEDEGLLAGAKYEATEDILRFVPSLVDAAADRVTAHVDGFTAVGITGTGQWPGPREVGADLIAASGSTPRQVRITWSDRYIDAHPSWVRIETARIVGGDPCPTPGGSCVCDADGTNCEWNGLQAPTTDDWTSLVDWAPNTFEYSYSIGSLGGMYYYRVLYRYSNGSASEPSTDLTRVFVVGGSEPPADPSRVSATALPCGGARVSWTAAPAVGDDWTATAWRIYRLPAAQSWELIATVPWDTVSYVDADPNLVPGANYYYGVRGINQSTVNGTVQSSPGNVYVLVTNADTEFTLVPSRTWVPIVPGTSQVVDLDYLPHVSPAPEVSLSFESTDPCNDGTCLAVSTTGPDDTSGFATFTLGATTPLGREIVGTIKATTATPTTCSVGVRILAADPFPNPTPVIDHIVPEFFTANPPPSLLAGDLTLEVHGTDFVDGATVRVDEIARATTFVSETQVDATLLPSDLDRLPSNPYANITARNPAPGGGVSNFLILTISSNPTPVITSISPEYPMCNGQAFVLTVNGTGFIPESTVLYLGETRTTTYVSSVQLTAQMLGTDRDTDNCAHNNAVTVSNPVGLVSNTVNLFPK